MITDAAEILPGAVHPSKNGEDSAGGGAVNEGAVGGRGESCPVSGGLKADEIDRDGRTAGGNCLGRIKRETQELPLSIGEVQVA
jgi:hypothetical protein